MDSPKQEDTKPDRLETASIVVGYAMSRLDKLYLTGRDVNTWREAYQEASQALSEPPASFKNLRDEFDPIHPNPREGWKYPIRPNRQRVLDELSEVSDEALIELVQRILKRDDEAIVEAIDALAVVTKVPANVAERLLTGRRAEEFFLSHSEELIQVASQGLIDTRQTACGYDFGVQGQPEKAVEVKGLKQHRGSIQFTDREWSEAKMRRNNYLLVIVGSLASEPVACVIADPHAALQVECKLQTSITAVWHTRVAV